jgi:hypothetical protein
MKLITLFCFLLFWNVAFAAYLPTHLQLIRLEPKSGKTFYGLVPLETLGDMTSPALEPLKVRALISVKNESQRINQPIEDESFGQVKIDFSGMNLDSVCFGDQGKCAMPAGKIQFFAPFPEQCKSESNFKKLDLRDLKQVTFFKTLTAEQVRAIREKLSYSHYVTHCQGDPIKLPEVSPYSSAGGEGGGYQFIYKNLNLLKRPMISTRFSEVSLLAIDPDAGMEDFVAYYAGSLDPKAKDYIQVRNSISHFCSKPKERQHLYLSESQDHTKKNSIIFDDLPESLASLPTDKFQQKFEEFLLSNVTPAYEKYLEKKKKELDLPQNKLRSELEKRIRDWSSQKISGPEALNPIELKFKNIDLNSSCIPQSGPTNWSRFSKCARSVLEEAFAQETETFRSQNNPIHVRCKGTFIEDPREAD